MKKENKLVQLRGIGKELWSFSGEGTKDKFVFGMFSDMIGPLRKIPTPE